MSKLFKVGIALGGLDVLALQKKEPCSGAGGATPATSVAVTAQQNQSTRVRQHAHGHQAARQQPKPDLGALAKNKKVAYGVTAVGGLATVAGAGMMLFGGKGKKWADLKGSVKDWDASMKKAEESALTKADLKDTDDKAGDLALVKQIHAAFLKNYPTVHSKCNLAAVGHGDETPQLQTEQEVIDAFTAGGAAGADDLCTGTGKEDAITAYKAIWASTQPATSMLYLGLVIGGLLVTLLGLYLLGLFNRLFTKCKRGKNGVDKKGSSFLEV